MPDETAVPAPSTDAGGPAAEVRATGALTAADVQAVTRLTTTASEVDGSAPLSEQFRLAVREPAEGDPTGVVHVLARRGDALVGYAQVQPGAVTADGPEPPAAELVVDPGARRRGVGTALLQALPPEVRLWSHAAGAAGDVASAFASARGLEPVRSLHVMARSLVDGPSWGAPDVPEGFAVRTFEPGRDEDRWVAVNAAAFAHHPEQGGLTRADLEERMAQPWFDAAGFLLVTPGGDPDRIAAFHWTKVDPPEGDVGEVYVVGVHPGEQGHGLGRVVTVLGLDHLAGRGLREVELYVDEDNVAAVRTYTRLGFVDREVHRQFARRDA
ncbi:mycothiol synthase [Terracoccus luteus]|uniref:Mycothiol acetyltransferase n=1 Tax=Terracoccus luteus TaxID=53356 RepID=A0A495XT74_9MICO|nr:mycothiol synthase [Terracoccus luteus]MBB2986739.1 mycothiol synthase [Terracoccus luteus]MCP2172390.1 mycothiol synthase [Terracoccus luteus]RKT76789.1 mycothiol synthase [Terracoccus luteus]